jgi:exodeoxyribonuclease V gamma subunit
VGWLRSLVELRDVGLTKPLPIPIATAAAWADAHAKSERGIDVDVKQAARREWETDRFAGGASFAKEDEDAYHVRVWGRGTTVEELIDLGLPEYALRVWGPLLAGAEKVGPL